MLAVEEALLILLISVIQDSFEQSTTVLSIKYEKVAVKASSFIVIRSTNLGSARYGWVLVLV